MADDETTGGRHEDPPEWTELHDAVFRVWRAGNALLDARYESKAIGWAVRQSLIDGEFRQLLLDDPQTAIERLRHKSDLPEGVEVAFFANDEGTLNVVLPRVPRSESNSQAFIDRIIMSRTGLGESLSDDWDLGDWGWSDHDSGDRDLFDPF